MKMNYQGYIIKPRKNLPTIYEVVTEGQGGKVPDVLTSLFTTRRTAMDAIDAYLENKVKKNGKASSEG